MEAFHLLEKELGRLFTPFEINKLFQANKYWPVDVENDWKDAEVVKFEAFYRTKSPRAGEVGDSPDYMDFQHAWDWNVWYSDYTIEKSKHKARIKTIKDQGPVDNDDMPHRKTVEYGKTA